MVYLTGGDPWYLVQSLRGSATVEALKHVMERGGIVAGSSAGAMALCQWVRGRGSGWQEGLGLVPGVAVIPRHPHRRKLCWSAKQRCRAACAVARVWRPPGYNLPRSRGNTGARRPELYAVMR